MEEAGKGRNVASAYAGSVANWRFSVPANCMCTVWHVLTWSQSAGGPVLESSACSQVADLARRGDQCGTETGNAADWQMILKAQVSY